MILSVMLPRMGGQTTQATIHKVLASPGEALRPGTALLEVRVDPGAANAQDCAPLYFFRIMSTERAVLRTLDVSAGQVLPVGGVLGVATSTADEPVGGQPGRALRTTSVAIQIDPLSR